MEQYPNFNQNNSGQNAYQNMGQNMNQNINPNMNQNNYNPQQNPYYFNNSNNFQNNYFFSQQRALKLKEQKREISKYATAFACAMLGMFLGSTVISIFLEIFNLFPIYESNTAFASSVGVFYSVFAVGLPFLIASKNAQNEKTKSKDIYKLPKVNAKTVSLIFLSVAGCIAAMYVTNIFALILESAGIYFTQNDAPDVQSITDVLAMWLGTSLIPPLVEEFAMRKVVLQPLRKYGNVFAIISSALIFGIFHGTATQIPFAILCGLFLGYAVIATESIWVSIIIHAIVNGLSCTYYTLMYFFNEKTAESVYTIISVTFAIIGLIAAVYYATKCKDEISYVFKQKGLSDFSTGEKVKKFILSPLMIITIIIFLINALQGVTTQSGVYS